MEFIIFSYIFETMMLFLQHPFRYMVQYVLLQPFVQAWSYASQQAAFFSCILFIVTILFLWRERRLTRQFDIDLREFVKSVQDDLMNDMGDYHSRVLDSLQRRYDIFTGMIVEQQNQIASLQDHFSHQMNILGGRIEEWSDRVVDLERHRNTVDNTDPTDSDESL